MFKRLKKIFYRGFKRDRFQLISRFDGVFLANYSNYIDRKLMVDGAYEREQIDLFRHYIEKANASIFVDIGANIGLYTISIGRSKSVSAIHSFEPVAENRNQLHANALLNGLSNKVQVYPYALSDSAGTTAFLCNTGNSTGRSRVKETNVNDLDESKFKEIVIETRVLDDLLPVSGDVIAVKIDVEGHELKVLDGMGGLLANNTCIIQLESYPSTTVEVVGRLEKLGYRLLGKIGEDHYFTNSTSLI